MITLTLSTYKALLASQAKKDVRYYLNGTLFTAHDPENPSTDHEVVATDGHAILITRYSGTPPEKGTIIPLPKVPAGYKGNDVTLTQRDTSATWEIGFDGTTILVDAEDGNYPNYQRLFEFEEIEKTSVVMTTIMLAHIAKVFAKATVTLATMDNNSWLVTSPTCDYKMICMEARHLDK